MSSLFFFLSISILQVTLFFASPTTADFLNITAIAAANGESTLECWQLSNPFAVSTQAGTVGSAVSFLGNVANASYLTLPPHFDGGLHNAPTVQWVSFLSGFIHVTMPCSNQEVWIKGGAGGLILATDIADVSKRGHITTYPSDIKTVAIAIPTADGEVPAHTLLHDGPCEGDELNV